MPAQIGFKLLTNHFGDESQKQIGTFVQRGGYASLKKAFANPTDSGDPATSRPNGWGSHMSASKSKKTRSSGVSKVCRSSS